MAMFNYEPMKKLYSTFDRSYGVKMWKNGKLIYDSTKSNVSPKPNNNAPKTIKGDYDLLIHGNKIVLVDRNEGTTVEAKCSPQDNFDVGEGVKEAFKKMNEKREEIRKAKEEEDKEIKVGDWVEVVDAGYGYRTWYDWLPSNRFDLIKNFAYGRYQKNGTKGLVMYIRDNVPGCYSDGTLVYYQDQEGMCYTIEINGLKKVKKPNV